MKSFKNTLLQGAIATLALTSGFAFANSTLVAPAAAGATATATLDFRVVIPRVLYIRIGAGVVGTGGTINLMDMSPAAANVGDASVIAATGGDVAANAVTVRIFGNGNSTISLNSATTGPLGNGTPGQTIPWSEITITPAALVATTAGFTNGVITHPAFNLAAGGGAGTVTALAPVAGAVRREGQWAVAYANTGLPAAGSYGGVNTQNGRVVYTVTMP